MVNAEPIFGTPVEILIGGCVKVVFIRMWKIVANNALANNALVVTCVNTAKLRQMLTDLVFVPNHVPTPLHECHTTAMYHMNEEILSKLIDLTQYIDNKIDEGFHPDAGTAEMMYVLFWISTANNSLMDELSDLIPSSKT